MDLILGHASVALFTAFTFEYDKCILLRGHAGLYLVFWTSVPVLLDLDGLFEANDSLIIIVRLQLQNIVSVLSPTVYLAISIDRN